MKCPVCGKEFEKKSRYQVYCSPECKRTKEDQRYEKVCPKCGKQFRTRKKTQKYCSRRCIFTKNKFNVNDGDDPDFVEITCLGCEKIFRAYPSRKFCSRDCFLKWRNNQQRSRALAKKRKTFCLWCHTDITDTDYKIFCKDMFCRMKYYDMRLRIVMKFPAGMELVDELAKLKEQGKDYHIEEIKLPNLYLLEVDT